MSKLTFAEDASSRKVTRILLLLQVTGLIAVICLRLTGFRIPAFVLSIVTMIVLFAGLTWLYARFRSHPLILEKNRLQHLLAKFKKNVQEAGKLIERSIRERERLL